METESILERVRKLMAKAKGTTNEHEATIFAAKAAELLAKHNLDEAMVREHEAKGEQGPIGSHDYNGRIPDRWRELIAMGCAKLYFSKLTVNTAGGKRVYTFHGREHNAKVAMLMMEYLIATVKRMAREYSPTKREQGDFRRGAGQRLYERLVELYDQQNAPPPASDRNPMNLPALYAGEQKAIDEHIAKSVGKLRPATRKGMKMGTGAAAGRSAANTISLNNQVARSRSAGAIR
tara:strand:+ start:2227 stop:2931 length:705 start_codon:yes stop_codon:yes gene_type:complete